MKARLKVWRGSAGETGGFERYEVPFEAGQTVLDGLRWIRVHRDPGLAIRFSCINAKWDPLESTCRHASLSIL